MVRALPPLLMALCIGCGSAPSDETPRGAVRLFLSAMERSAREPGAAEEAYRLLSAPARLALQERAHMAVQVGARPMEPWEMLARSRYRQSFTIASGPRAMRESIDGERATVTVRAQDGQRTARVPLVLESGRWRIELAIPPARERVEEAEEPAPEE